MYFALLPRSVCLSVRTQRRNCAPKGPRPAGLCPRPRQLIKRKIQQRPLTTARQTERRQRNGAGRPAEAERGTAPKGGLCFCFQLCALFISIYCFKLVGERAIRAARGTRPASSSCLWRPPRLSAFARPLDSATSLLISSAWLAACRRGREEAAASSPCPHPQKLLSESSWNIRGSNTVIIITLISKKENACKISSIQIYLKL